MFSEEMKAVAEMLDRKHAPPDRKEVTFEVNGKTSKQGLPYRLVEKRIYDNAKQRQRWPSHRDVLHVLVGVAFWLGLQALAGTLR